jgi:hypothetical protein
MEDKSISAGHSRRDVLRYAAASALGLTFPGSVSAAADNSVAPSGVSGPLRSAGALTFGSNNVLFVGDIKGAKIHAFALRDEDLTAQTDVVSGNFHNFEGRDQVVGLDEKMAALLGTAIDKIVINDMTVHQPTEQVFFSVERGRGTDAIPAIVKVNHGQLEVLELDRIPHSQVSLPNEPDGKDMLEFEPQQVYAITDLQFYKGDVFVSGITNQRFASTLHRIPYPFNSNMATCTVEIWHPVHGQFETRPPIIRHVIHEVNSEPYLFGVYGCTPLVRIPLSALKDGAHVHGDVIGELGYGANPVDMLTFTSPADSKDYLLVTIDTRSASQIAVSDLASAPAGPTGGPIDFGPVGLGRTQRALPIKAEHIAILNPKWAVLVWRHPKTTYRLDLSTLALPYFFERKDGMSEMNWPNGPDPFHYREHKNELTNQ